MFLWMFNDRDTRPQRLGGRIDVAPGHRRGLNSEALSSFLLCSSGSIRLPKAAKTPLKIHPLVRLPLATIVKDLGRLGYEEPVRWFQAHVVSGSQSSFYHQNPEI